MEDRVFQMRRSCIKRSNCKKIWRRQEGQGIVKEAKDKGVVLYGRSKQDPKEGCDLRAIHLKSPTAGAKMWMA